MRNFLNAITNLPHPEEARSAVSKDANLLTQRRFPTLSRFSLSQFGQKWPRSVGISPHISVKSCAKVASAMSDASKIVAAFQQAMGRGDFLAARKLLRDDVSFRGPIGTFDSADALMEALKRLQSFVERADVRKMFADGDDVCVLFDLVTNTPGGTALVAEWYRVEGGKIAMMRAMFDARRFAAMLGSEAN